VVTKYYIGKEDGQAKMLPCDGSEGNVDRYVLEDDAAALESWCNTLERNSRTVYAEREEFADAAVEQERADIARSISRLYDELVDEPWDDGFRAGIEAATDTVMYRGPHRDFRGLAEAMDIELQYMIDLGDEDTAILDHRRALHLRFQEMTK